MNLEFNIPNMVDLKKSYDEDGYNHIPQLFSPADMDIPVSYTHLTLPTTPYV